MAVFPIFTREDSEVSTNLQDQIRELLAKDPGSVNLVQLVEQGKSLQFWFDDGLLYTRRNCLYVPKGGELRKRIIMECHDTLCAGHPGPSAMRILLVTNAG